LRWTLLLLTVLGLFPCAAIAQAQQDNVVEEFGKKWQARATKTQAEQPKWAVPMYSPFPMIAQVFRLDYVRQRVAGGADNWNIGGGKGFNFIPFAKTQIDVFIPGYVLHGDGAQDGFGDTTVVGKYRFLSANEKKGNYAVSAGLGISMPTGSYKNGAASTALTPALLAGKGFGKLALFSSLGGTLPTSGTNTSGRTIHWNTVAQYKVGKYLTPELELNSNTWAGGTRDGKTQMFLSPGLIAKLPLRPSDSGSRIGLVFGVAFQTALSSYYTYNHGLAVTTRFSF
jgi:hypothetical protein